MTATAKCPHCGGQLALLVPRPLTPKQRAVLVYLMQALRETGVAPSYPEIARALRLRSVATVAEHVDQLERKGWVSRSPSQHRSLSVLHSPE